MELIGQYLNTLTLMGISLRQGTFVEISAWVDDVLTNLTGYVHWWDKSSITLESAYNYPKLQFVDIHEIRIGGIVLDNKVDYMMQKLSEMGYSNLEMQATRHFDGKRVYHFEGYTDALMLIQIVETESEFQVVDCGAEADQWVVQVTWPK